MAIEKTIEVCRRKTTSPLIKSVLKASVFESPKDVVVKLITQIDKTKAESQILSYQRSTSNWGRGNFNNARGRFNKFSSNNNDGHFNNQFQNSNSVSASIALYYNNNMHRPMVARSCGNV